VVIQPHENSIRFSLANAAVLEANFAYTRQLRNIPLYGMICMNMQ
jgi:hypothetical protein